MLGLGLGLRLRLGFFEHYLHITKQSIFGIVNLHFIKVRSKELSYFVLI